MASKAGAMSIKAQELIVLSEEAFLSATKDKTLTDRERVKAQEQMAAATVKAEKLKILVNQLAEDKARVAEKEQIFAKKAAKECKKAFLQRSIATSAAIVTPQGSTMAVANTSSSLLMQTVYKNTSSNNEQAPADMEEVEDSQKSESEGISPVNGDMTLEQMEALANQWKWEIRKTQRETNSVLAVVLNNM
eukprot:15291494-Ditylum_brightwellii.AAC.1